LDWLPGREAYAASLDLIELDRPDPSVTLSLYPLATESAWLSLLLPVAVFVATRTLDHRRLYRLILLLIAIAAAQAILGLAQFGRGADSPLYFGMTHASFGNALGTYPNRNHLAGLLEMVLPITLALYLYSLGRIDRQVFQGWRGRISFFSTIWGNRAFVFGALALLLLVGVVFTRSRTGIALTMIGILLATLAFGRRIGGDNVYGPAGTIVAFAVGIGFAIGLAPVWDRFAEQDPMEDARWTVFSATMDGIGSFFPVGSGPGTYEAVMHAFQPVELGHAIINHAHNDYLEWLFEGGAFAAVLIVVLLTLYFIQWGRVWTRAAWSRFRFVQVGAGIGLLLLLLHELTDYNLHIPANMVFFAFLAGVFSSDPAQEEASRSRRQRKRRTGVLQPATGASDPTTQWLRPAPDQIRNPFSNPEKTAD